MLYYADFIIIVSCLMLVWLIYYNTSFHRNDDLSFKNFERHAVVPDEILKEFAEKEKLKNNSSN